MYDVILIGAGPANIFLAYKLLTNKPGLRVLMIEKGNSIENRRCPQRDDNSMKCVGCNVCSITSGFSGAGAFSDGKLTLASSITGGCLDELLGEEKMRELIQEADSIYLSFGADKNLKGIDKECISRIRKKAIQANMKLVESPIRHLGTDGAFSIYEKMQAVLKDMGVEMHFNETVESIKTHTGEDGNESVCAVITQKSGKLNKYDSGIIVAGTGREGSSWFKDICDTLGVKTQPGTVDMGVRVECRNEVMEELNNSMYESKLIYHSRTYADRVRTFCQNPGGEVALENYNLPDGSRIRTVNGHAYKDAAMKTDNTNFALLVSKNFTEPFREPLEYGAAYARIANMLAGGTVLVQSYGDIKRGRRSTPERILQGNVIPTLKDAVPGDLMSCIPARIMSDIIEMIEAMDNIAPGIANDETLLYGIEVKFYSNKVIIDMDGQTSLKGLYAVGDSSSWTRGLSFASAMGLHVGNAISKKFDTTS